MSYFCIVTSYDRINHTNSTKPQLLILSNVRCEAGQMSVYQAWDTSAVLCGVFLKGRPHAYFAWAMQVGVDKAIDVAG